MEGIRSATGVTTLSLCSGRAAGIVARTLLKWHKHEGMLLLKLCVPTFAISFRRIYTHRPRIGFSHVFGIYKDHNTEHSMQSMSGTACTAAACVRDLSHPAYAQNTSSTATTLLMRTPNENPARDYLPPAHATSAGCCCCDILRRPAPTLPGCPS